MHSRGTFLDLPLYPKLEGELIQRGRELHFKDLWAFDRVGIFFKRYEALQHGKRSDLRIQQPSTLG